MRFRLRTAGQSTTSLTGHHGTHNAVLVSARARVAIGALILMASMLVVPSAFAATVQQAKAACPSGAACLWNDGDYTTYSSVNSKLHLFYFIGDLGAFNYSGGFPPSGPINAKNSVSSIFNNGNTDRLFSFTGTYKQQDGFIMPRNTGVSLAGSAWNDDLESVYFESCLDGVC